MNLSQLEKKCYLITSFDIKHHKVNKIEVYYILSTAQLTSTYRHLMIPHFVSILLYQGLTIETGKCDEKKESFQLYFESLTKYNP